MDFIGDRMVIMHAKDFIIEDGWIKMVPVGTGLLNYDAIFKLIKPKKPYHQCTVRKYARDRILTIVLHF